MKLDQIRAIIEAATPGPWELDEYASELFLISQPDRSPHLQIFGTESERQADARFIAASRTLMPKLLAVAEAAKTHRYYLTRQCICCDEGRDDESCTCTEDLAKSDAACRALDDALAALEAE